MGSADVSHVTNLLMNGGFICGWFIPGIHLRRPHVTRRSIVTSRVRSCRLVKYFPNSIAPWQQTEKIFCRCYWAYLLTRQDLTIELLVVVSHFQAWSSVTTMSYNLSSCRPLGAYRLYDSAYIRRTHGPQEMEDGVGLQVWFLLSMIHWPKRELQVAERPSDEVVERSSKDLMIHKRVYDSKFKIELWDNASWSSVTW